MDRVVCYPAPAPLRTRVLEVLDALGVEWGAVHTTTRTLLDTFDGRIGSAGSELSVIEAGGCRLRLWGTRLSPVTVDVTGPPRFVDEIPSAFVRRHLAFVAPRALLPIVATTTTTRAGELRAPDGTLAARVLLHDDLRDPVTGATQLDLVVELDLRPGHEAVTRRLRKHLERLHLVPVPGTALGELLRVLDIDTAAHHPTRVALDRRMPAIGGVRLVLGHLATTVVEHRAGTIDEVDPEFLHDLRIAVRRTRTILRQARRVLPDGAPASAREDFSWLGAVTGPARDLDVAVGAWERDFAALGDGIATSLAPLRARLEERRVLAHRELAAALASPRFDDALGAWQAWLAAPLDPATLPDRADRPLGRFVARRLQRAHERLVEHGRLIDRDSPPEQLHELRKDAKHLRYLFDCFGGVIPTEAARPLVRPLKRLLTTLGEHQDSEVRLAELDDIVRSLGRRRRPAATDAAIAALRGLLEVRQEAARAEFAHRFRDLDQRTAHRALAETVARLRR